MRNIITSIFLLFVSLVDAADNTYYLRGGDLTMVTYIEDWGAHYRYQDGTVGDVFAILQSYGVNLARLRLYNHPGTPSVMDGITYRLPIRTTAHPNGYAYAGPEDILHLAKRAKNHDMQICLSLHLSDFWSNAGLQSFPAAWNNISTYSVLRDSVTQFVSEFMQQMVDQGTPPEYVSIGNETNYGMLFGPNNQHAPFGGYGDYMTQWVGLFNAAYDAVKAVCPTSKVIFHHSMGHAGKINDCQWLFDKLIRTYKIKIDVIGGSYYPYWASIQNAKDDTPTGMLQWTHAMESRYKLPIMIMEVGYSWSQYNNPQRNGGNWEGQLHTNGSYGAALATEQGQADFMAALHNAIESDSAILGYLYWDPIYIDQKVGGKWIQSCWAEKLYNGSWYYEDNAVANTTWFDYTGLPLRALYQEINSRKQPSALSENKILYPSCTTKQMIEDQLIIVHNQHQYNVLGQEK